MILIIYIFIYLFYYYYYYIFIIYNLIISTTTTKKKDNPVPLSAAKLIHESKEIDQKILLKALKSQMLTSMDNVSPFSLPPTIPDKNSLR